ncbi:c-type cytochrome [Candidatus Nitrospira bockiana]
MPRTGLALFLTLVACIGGAHADGLGVDASPGRSLYEQHCARCHGGHGRGDGPQARWQMVAPANFHSSASRAKSDEQLLAVITHGVIFSPMHAWGDRLTLRQRQELLAYIRTLAESGP